MTTRIAWSTKLTGPGLTEWFPGIPVIDLAPCRHEVFVHWSALCTSQCAWCSCSALCGGSSNLTWQQLHSDMRPGICPIYIHYDVQCHGTPSFKLFMLLGVGTFNALASNTKGLTAKGVFFLNPLRTNWLVFVFQVFWILLACPSEKNRKMSSRNSPLVHSIRSITLLKSLEPVGTCGVFHGIVQINECDRLMTETDV